MQSRRLVYCVCLIATGWAMRKKATKPRWEPKMHVSNSRNTKI